MSNRVCDRTFLHLLCVSILLHLGVFAGLYYLPQATLEPAKETVFIDLQNMPELKQPPEQHQQETARLSEQRVRVSSESAPQGDAAKDSQSAGKPPARSAVQELPAFSRPAAQSTAPSQPPVAPGSSIASLLKPKVLAVQQSPSTQQLFPGASRLAKLEDSYRRKFESDITDGDTRFLNSDDIMFGSFLRRFEGAVYGVWRYPQEAAMRGIEGITPVRITFNSRGEITNIQLLESSGARILDEEVLRTLRAIGPMGGFPKGYDKEVFHLIAFFQYGGARRSLR